MRASYCVPTRPAVGGSLAASSSAEPLGLGCGDPIALAKLEPGEAVLDLGCGAGSDCFRAVERVGRSGRVIGVDMTPDMLDRARAAAAATDLRNVEFRLGEIEHLPVADGSVDVVLSNCTVNLSTDKPAVFREAWRVLRPSGRLALSETMTDGPLPEAVRAALGSAADSVWTEAEYVAGIEAAGFVEVTVERVEIDPSLGAAIPSSTPAVGVRARALVRVAETGETRVVDLDELPPGLAIGSSFSGRIKARKPESREDTPP